MKRKSMAVAILLGAAALLFPLWLSAMDVDPRPDGGAVSAGERPIARAAVRIEEEEREDQVECEGCDHQRRHHPSCCCRCSGAGGGFLGVHLTDLTPELRQHFGVEETAGVLVAKVQDDSPAEEAGIQVGDVLVAIEGEEIDSPWEARREIAGRDAGEEVSLELYRDGKKLARKAVLAEGEGVFHWGFRGLRHIPHVPLPELRDLGDEIDDALDAVDWDEIERHIDKSLGAVDWDEIGERIEKAISEGLRALEDLDIDIDVDLGPSRREVEKEPEKLEMELEELEDTSGPTV